MTKAIDKTFIGGISIGLDFLSQLLNERVAQGVTIVQWIWLNHMDKRNPLMSKRLLRSWRDMLGGGGIEWVGRLK